MHLCPLYSTGTMLLGVYYALLHALLLQIPLPDGSIPSAVLVGGLPACIWCVIRRQHASGSETYRCERDLGPHRDIGPRPQFTGDICPLGGQIP